MSKSEKMTGVEVAKLAGVTWEVLSAWIEMGSDLPARKQGHVYLFHRPEVLAWMGTDDFKRLKQQVADEGEWKRLRPGDKRVRPDGTWGPVQSRPWEKYIK